LLIPPQPGECFLCPPPRRELFLSPPPLRGRVRVGGRKGNGSQSLPSRTPPPHPPPQGGRGPESGGPAPNHFPHPVAGSTAKPKSLPLTVACGGRPSRSRTGWPLTRNSPA